MIRLTKSGNGEPVYVSPDLIVSAEIVDEVTMLNVRSDRIFVTESPEEVALKVLVWRLAMERYRAAYAEVMRNSTLAGPDLEEAEQDMLKLAGLGEPKNAHP